MAHQAGLETHLAITHLPFDLALRRECSDGVDNDDVDGTRADEVFCDFLNYDLLETYKDFGGIRIEDDILITDTGNRMLGQNIIPYKAGDVEAFVSLP